jgi:hypothetical protein
MQKYPVEVPKLVLAQQPDIGEFRQAAKLVYLIIDFDDFQL